MHKKPNIGLEPLELSAVFPFHLAFDHETKILQAGDVLQRLLPNLSLGDKLEEHFRVYRPKVALDFESIRSQTDILFILEATCSMHLVLKGQMKHLKSRNTIMFLCSPWLVDLSDISTLGLTLNDFAIHDSIGDYLFLLQTQDTSLADANQLSDRLVELNKELEDRVDLRTQELRSANEALARDIQRRQIAETRAQSLNAELVRVSRAAGMAEVATGVLHDVGNVLNSVNVGAQLLDDRIRGLGFESVRKAAELIEEHKNDLADFLANDEQGIKFAPYLKQLSEHLDQEKRELLEETEVLQARVEHIKTIVSKQQRYATPLAAIETCSIADLVKQAIDFIETSFARHKIEMVVKCVGLPDVSVDRHYVMQILINLLRNAKQALIDVDKIQKRVEIDANLIGDGLFCIRVADNGVGILPEDINKIFTHGFTTKEGGHGFGLHNACNAAKAMGGELSCTSSGHNQGSVFTLELPVRATTRTRGGVEQ